ncbi:hypothetical protein BGZ81_004918 [Podila clonocystis]|nr:hypothetical protein BGZ81_004918 [Podila clonocystis]
MGELLPQDPSSTRDSQLSQDQRNNHDPLNKKSAFKSMLRQRQIAVRHSKGSSTTTSDTHSRHSQSTFTSSFHDTPATTSSSMYPQESQGISLKTLREEAEASGHSTYGHYHQSHGHSNNNTTNHFHNNSSYGISTRHNVPMKEEPITIHGPAEPLFTRPRNSSNGNSPRDESFGSQTDTILTTHGHGKDVTQEAFDLREILMQQRSSRPPPPRVKQELILTFNNPKEPSSEPQPTTRPHVSVEDNVSTASMELPQTIRFLPVSNDLSSDPKPSVPPTTQVAPVSLITQTKPVLPATTKFPLPPKPDIAHAKIPHPPSQAQANGGASGSTLSALEESLKQKLLSQKRDDDKTSTPASPLTLTTINDNAFKTPSQTQQTLPQQQVQQTQQQKQQQQQEAQQTQQQKQQQQQETQQTQQQKQQQQQEVQQTQQQKQQQQQQQLKLKQQLQQKKPKLHKLPKLYNKLPKLYKKLKPEFKRNNLNNKLKPHNPCHLSQKANPNLNLHLSKKFHPSPSHRF